MPVTIRKVINRAAPFRNVGILRHLDECDSMVFVIIGHEADNVVAKHNMRAKDGLIPPDDFIDLFCLDDNMREKRRWNWFVDPRAWAPISGFEHLTFLLERMI